VTGRAGDDPGDFADVADAAPPLDLLLSDAALGITRRFRPDGSTLRFGLRLARHPWTVTRRSAGLAGELGKIAVGRSAVAPAPRDRRFADPAWMGNPFLRRILQAYLAGGALAESLLAHGKVREAKHFIERAGAQAGQARRLAELLATDPKLPDDLDPPRFPGSLSAKEQEKLARQYMQVEKLMRTGQYEEAQKLLDDWPSEIADQSGADLALLYGTIAWHADAYSDALEALRPLEKDPAYLLRRPEALHVIGRLYYSVEEYGKAVGLLKRYLSVRPIATR